MVANLLEIKDINFYSGNEQYSFSIKGKVFANKLVYLEINTGNLKAEMILPNKIDIKPHSIISVMLRDYLGSVGFFTINENGTIKIINNMKGNYVGNIVFAI